MATYYNVWREKSPQNFTFHRVLRIRAAQNVAFIIGPNFSLVSIRVLNVEDGREIPKLSGVFFSRAPQSAISISSSPFFFCVPWSQAVPDVGWNQHKVPENAVYHAPNVIGS